MIMMGVSMNSRTIEQQHVDVDVKTLLLAVIDKLEALSHVVLASKPILNIEEASTYTGLTASYIYKLTSTQEIPHFKPRGKMLYFRRDELDAWLLQRRVKTTSEIDAEAVNHVVTSKRGLA